MPLHLARFQVLLVRRMSSQEVKSFCKVLCQEMLSIHIGQVYGSLGKSRETGNQNKIFCKKLCKKKKMVSLHFG